MHPVNADIALDNGNKFMRDHPESWLSHYLPRTLVLGQSIIKGYLFVGETRFFAAGARCPNVLGKLNQFLDNLRRSNCVGVIPSDGRL